MFPNPAPRKKTSHAQSRPGPNTERQHLERQRDLESRIASQPYDASYFFFFYPFLVAFNVVGRPRNKSPDKVLATETPSINVTSPRGKLPRINDCVFSRFVYTFHVRRTSQALPRERRHIQSCRGTSIDAFRPIRIKTSTALWFFLILQRESYTKLGYKAPLVSCSRSGTLRCR